MTTAQDNKTQSSPAAAVPSALAPSTSVGSTVSKEHEVRVTGGAEEAKEISPKLEVAKEVEKAGVVKIGETIELPPDVTKLGVTPIGPSAPVTTTPMPQVVLPISDQQVVAGLHAQITTAIRWLALWCIKKLQKTHLALKVIHGKITRVKI